VWQAQYTEPPGGAGARVGALGPWLEAQYTESSGAAARVGAAGMRLAFVSQTGFPGKGTLCRLSHHL